MNIKYLRKNIKIPTDWRIGQTLFNFLAWVQREKVILVDSSGERMADPFHYPDEQLVAFYKEFIKTQK